jgi:uncharacterized LabA/DUF88 family protein
MKHYTYIDQSNFFIEGQRLSAVHKRMAYDVFEAQERQIIDFRWHPDYKRVYQFLCGENKDEIGCAKILGSTPPGDPFWQALSYIGFEVTTFEKSFAGKEKKVDVAVTYQTARDAYTVVDKANDEINLVVGDKDYVPLIEGLISDGFRVVVIFWDHAAPELRRLGAEFLSLNSQLEHFAW